MVTFGLDGAEVLVTGASRGIGAAAAEALGAAGAAPAHARSPAIGRRWRGGRARAGGETRAVACDVTDAAARATPHSRASTRIDVLVHAAGGNVPRALLDVDLATADRLWALNVRAGLQLSQLARGPDARGRRGDRVLSSQMGHVGAPRRSVYCATKHAVEGLTKAMAVELAPRGVRVVAIAPTFVETPMTAPFLADPALPRRHARADPARPARHARGRRRRDRVRRIAGRGAGDAARASASTAAGRRGEGRRAMSEATVRLTTGQALVRWLQAQWSERDGVRAARGARDVRDLRPRQRPRARPGASPQEGAELPFHQPKNEQAMVHTAIGYAKAARRLQALACTASIGPGATNMLTGAATATVNRLPVLLLPADTFASRRSGVVLQQLEHPLEARRHGQRRVPAAEPLLRPHRAARAAAHRAARRRCACCSTRPRRAPSTIALHQDVLGRGGDFPVGFFAPRTWRGARRRARTRTSSPTPSRCCARRGGRWSIAGGGVRPFGGGGGAAGVRACARACRSPRPRPARARCRRARSRSAASGSTGPAAANRVAAEADLVLCVGTRLTDFTTGSLLALPAPGRALRRDQRLRRGRAQAVRGAGGRGRAARARGARARGCRRADAGVPRAPSRRRASAWERALTADLAAAAPAA